MKILLVQIKFSPNPSEQFFPKHILQIKEVLPNADVVLVTVDEARNELADTEIVITSDPNTIDPKKAPSLRWMHITWAGVDTLSKEMLESSILVTNSSGVHPNQISEHVFSFALTLTRKINESIWYQTKGEWNTNFSGQVGEMHGLTMGIIGLGRIGKEIARIAKAFRMNVLGLVRDASKKYQHVDSLFTPENKDQFYQQSDYVVCTLPLTTQTRHMITYEDFAHMKPTSYFINIGRGAVVKEADLVKALQEKKIAGAGLDVFEKELLPKESPLWQMKNVIITPHFAGWSPHYTDRVIDIFCRNLTAYLEKAPMPNLIDKKQGY